MRSRLLVGVAVLATVVIACGGGDESTVFEGEDAVVRMFDNRYEYTEIRIPPGGTVDFVGGGRNPHNAVAADQSWSTEDVFGSLEQFEDDSAVIQFEEPGEYPFFCTFHGSAEGDGMAGTVIVGTISE